MLRRFASDIALETGAYHPVSAVEIA
jgi:hypothetical protein